MNFQYSDSIIGSSERIELIPYRQDHVKEYNKWLQCRELQELTETEPCSLNEEYGYQREWEEDNQQTKLIKLIKLKDSDQLIGDVNLFFEEDCAEINIMIADPKYRGKGIAKEVLDLIIDYLRRSEGRKFSRIIAKVLSKNTASIKFFEKYGFVREGGWETVFKEIILVFSR